MVWGYGAIWLSDFIEDKSNHVLSRLKLLKKYGLRTTGIDIEETGELSAVQQDQIVGFLSEYNLHLNFHISGFYFDKPDQEADTIIDGIFDVIERNYRSFRSRMVTTCVGPFHRFMGNPSLQTQLGVLKKRLAPVAKRCAGLGLPIGIENHGDYYVRDLVEVCREVPHLGLFLDTGNTYLIGEQPLSAIEAGTPYAMGSHFKDHHVCPCPDARPLHFEVGPSVIGEGDVPLIEAYRLFRENAPDPDNLGMEIELIPPGDVDPHESLRRSVEFIRKLEEQY